MAESVTLTAILSVKDKMTSTLKSVENATGGLGSRFKSMVGAGAAMQVGMRAVNTAMSAISGSVDAAVSRVDTLNQFPKLMNQMGLASEKTAEKVKGNLVKAIEGLPTSLDEIVASTKNIAVLTGDLDTASDTAVALNDAFLASGSSSADASRGLTQYQQMLAKGKVDQQAWNTLTETMGYGLDKAAKSMLGAEANQRDLYSALQSGEITFDDFNKELIKLDKAEGGFAETARTASVGIATSMSNIQTAITAGLANSINALDKAMKDSGVKWLEGGIAGTLDNVKVAVSTAFKQINSAIAGVNVKGIVNGLAPAFNILKTAATGAFKAVSKILGFINDHAEGTAKAATGVAAFIMAFKGYQKISGFKKALAGATQETFKFKKVEKLAEKGTYKLKSGLGSLAKMTGVALVAASLALLVKAMTGLAALGETAVMPLVTFGIVVGGLAAVFAEVGKSLQKSSLGIGVFAASVSAMAYTMSLVASTGTEGAKAMIAFGVVVAGLAAVFALLGPALTASALGIGVLGAAVALIGVGMKQATPFVTAFGSMVSQAGRAVSVAADGIGEGFKKISDGAAKVINAISGGFSSVLDSIAGVIESVGTSAKNAGAGFLATAKGIGAIAQLSIWDIGKSLSAVAAGLIEISSGGKNLPQIASGMQLLVTNITTGSAGLTAFNTAMTTMAGLTTTAASAITTLKTAFSGFTIPAPNAAPFIAAFTSIIAASRKIIPALTSAGKSAGAGLASGLSSGCSRTGAAVSRAISSSLSAVAKLAVSMKSAGSRAGTAFASSIQKGMSKATTVSRQAANKVNQSLRSGATGARAAGAFISQGFASGMLSCLGTIEAAADRMVTAANKAIEAKAKIHSPSKVTEEYGGFYGAGWVNGIKDKYRQAKKAAEGLMSVPQVRPQSFALAGAYNDNYIYGSSRSFTVEVPVIMDGKRVARVIAPHTEAELNKRQIRASRKKGVR